MNKALSMLAGFVGTFMVMIFTLNDDIIFCCF